MGVLNSLASSLFSPGRGLSCSMLCVRRPLSCVYVCVYRGHVGRCMGWRVCVCMCTCEVGGGERER